MSVERKMIHIATVHWCDDRWIDIQLKYLKMFITEPYRIYAFLNGLEHDYKSLFFYASSEPIQSHAIKLNLLADIASFNADSEDDLLIFIDGDAFPIDYVLPFAYSTLSKYRLMAIQRKENCGDIQPHPSFCLTTIKLWKEINGDWKAGYEWKDERGRNVNDVGGNLLKILNERGINWYPMLRSNRSNIHPLWFGIYDNLIYHHGAGFRPPVSRLDLAELSNIGYFNFSKLPRCMQKLVPRKYWPDEKMVSKNRTLSEEIFASILSDPLFYKRFDRVDPGDVHV